MFDDKYKNFESYVTDFILLFDENNLRYANCIHWVKFSYQ